MIANQMLKNMCLLKAWMFAAGLLLGFASFAQQGSATKETDTSFRQVREVLKELSLLSPQARHYHDILTSLTDAIDLSQRKLADERKQRTSQYLDQIFTRDDPGNLDDMATVGFEDNSELNANVAMSFDPAQTWDAAIGLDNMTTGPYGLMISEGFPWPADDLDFDWQAYDPFLEDGIS